MKSRTWELEVLTSLHIGSGETWTAFDYVYDKRARLLRVIDLDKLLAQPRVRPEDLAQYYERRGFQIAQYLQDRGIAPADVERYHLSCSREPGNGPVRVFVKTPYSKPYLPGSSLKGALRTAVLWSLLHSNSTAFQKALNYLQRVIRENRSLPRSARNRHQWTGLNIERLDETLGPEPNTDLMRALHIEDSAELSLETLEVVEVGSYLLNAQGQLARDGRLTSWAEGLKPGTRVQIRVHLDEFLFSQMAGELGLQPKQKFVDESLFETIRNFSDTLLESEIAFYRQRGLLEVADRLQAFAPSGDALLCLGWGGGWSTKTTARAFVGKPELDFMALRKIYRLGQSRSRRDFYHEVFPKSRRLAISQAPMPLGWVRVKEV